MREILIYGIIGDDWMDEGITATSFKRQMDALNADPTCESIKIRINSPGGYISDGLAIVNTIKDSKKPVHTVNDGFAFSMAAPILMAGKTVSAARNSLIMIHNAWGSLTGNSKELEGELENMQKIDEVLAQSIADRSGKSLQEIQERFFDFKDHTLTAQEALDEGMIDEVLDFESEGMANFKDPQSATRKAVFNHFKTAQKAQETNSLVDRIANKISAMLNNNSPKTEKMNFELLNSKLDQAENGKIELSAQEITDLKAEIQAAKEEGDVITASECFKCKS